MAAAAAVSDRGRPTHLSARPRTPATPDRFTRCPAPAYPRSSRTAGAGPVYIRRYPGTTPKESAP
ncbi:hypothetical protein GCM10023224_06360 [Streptomonospora halophila]|uniref:Uncharacterized protein n=1 Tax=Streptomonospora halophila TaxID=427369 RepID=A0ABP9G6D4_9ACTN